MQQDGSGYVAVDAFSWERPQPRQDGTGDLLVNVHINLPAALTAQQAATLVGEFDGLPTLLAGEQLFVDDRGAAHAEDAEADLVREVLAASGY